MRFGFKEVSNLIKRMQSHFLGESEQDALLEGYKLRKFRATL